MTWPTSPRSDRARRRHPHRRRAHPDRGARGAARRPPAPGRRPGGGRYPGRAGLDPRRPRAASAARSSPTPRASNSRCSTPTRGGSSGCACAACRRRAATGRACATVPEARRLLRVRAGARVDDAAVPARGRTWRRSPAGGATGSPLCSGVGAAAALPPVDLTPLLLVVVSRPVVARRRQRRPGRVVPARLGASASAFFSPASIGSPRRCLSISTGSGGWCRSPRPGCRPALRSTSALALLAARLARARLRAAGDGAGLRLCRRLERAEWVRGHALTGLAVEPRSAMPGRAGFPARSAMLQSTAWVGIYGLSFRDRPRRLVAGAARRAVAWRRGPRRDAGRRRSRPGC